MQTSQRWSNDKATGSCLTWTDFRASFFSCLMGRKVAVSPPPPRQPGAARAGPPRPDPCPPLRLHFRELACSVMWQQPPSTQPGRPVNIYRAAERRSPGRSWTAGGGWGARRARGHPPDGGGWAPGLCMQSAEHPARSLQSNLVSQTEGSPSEIPRRGRAQTRGLPQPAANWVTPPHGPSRLAPSLKV